MKIRTGFVSNSSSSSFVLSVPKKKNLDKVKIEIEANLEDYLQDRITSKLELDDYMDGYWGKDYEDTDMYKEYLNEI